MRAAVESICGYDAESFSLKRGCAIRFQMSQPVETGHLRPSSASTGPLKNMDESSPARKRMPVKRTKKLAAFQALRTSVARTGLYEDGAPHKAGAGANRSRVLR
jgi:hypothetical protein